tara:strand:+ start:359 stop:556 length:198 start_codon:yes stop_codon:yes gene_type:complete
MSRTGEYFLEMAERNNWIEADKYYEELKNDQYVCLHKTVIMPKLDGKPTLVCEGCGEDLTKETIG